MTLPTISPSKIHENIRRRQRVHAERSGAEAIVAHPLWRRCLTGRDSDLEHDSASARWLGSDIGRLLKSILVEGEGPSQNSDSAGGGYRSSCSKSYQEGLKQTKEEIDEIYASVEAMQAAGPGEGKASRKGKSAEGKSKEVGGQQGQKSYGEIMRLAIDEFSSAKRGGIDKEASEMLQVEQGVAGKVLS